MSETWKVHLVFTEDKSNKFWRARTEGSTLIVNYGRIGSEGQSTVKDMGSISEAESSLEKQAAAKRKKGYVDTEAPAEPSPAPAEQPTGPQSVTMTLEQGGRAITLTLACDGQLLRTEVAETYDSPARAQAAFTRIQQALLQEGYKRAR